MAVSFPFVLSSKSGLDPTGNTYTVLMCNFAKNGDIAAIKQTLSDAQEADVYIGPSHIYRTVIALADNAHAEHIPQVTLHIFIATGICIGHLKLLN